MTWISCEGWPEKVKLMQKNWIGRSEGAEVTFQIEGFDRDSDSIYTTRPDTLLRRHLYGHGAGASLCEGTGRRNGISRQRCGEFIDKLQHMSDIDRSSTTLEKDRMYSSADMR